MSDYLEGLNDSLASQDLTVTTDKADYAPGEIAFITASGLEAGETVQFAIADDPNAPGNDGDADVYAPFSVTDGGPGDIDGIANGQIVTGWFVPIDNNVTGSGIPDALNATLFLTATSSTGQVGTTTFTDSFNAAQTYFIPLREADLYNSFTVIDQFLGATPTSIVSLTAIAIAAAGTQIRYSHWENGYNNPLIWGDGITSNGVAPGDADDLLVAGQSIILQNNVQTPRPFTPGSVPVLFDGSDKIESSLPIAITRGAWPNGDPGSLLAGGVEVLSTDSWGRNYVVPVGPGLAGDITNAFEYTTLYVMAGQDNTNLTLIRNGNPVALADNTLNTGESVVISVQTGDILTSNNNVQVDLVYGDVNSTYEMRWSSLIPREQLTNEYYTPVGTVIKADGGATVVWLHNPADSGKTITVNYDFLGGGSPDGSITLAPGETKKSPFVPDGSGARFFSNPGDVFFAISQTDANNRTDGNTAENGQRYDWDTVLVPSNQLTSAALVGWGAGTTDNLVSGPSRSVVWVTPTINTDIHVDRNNDGIVDQTFANVNPLQSIKITDPTDNNMTGAVIFTMNPNAKLAFAWGQDPGRSTGNDFQALDLGTLIPNISFLSMNKEVIGVTNPDNSPDSDGIVDQAGDKINYRITVSNVGFNAHTNVVVTDPMYVGADGVSGTADDGIVATIPIMMPSTTQSFNFSYTVTQSDLDSNATLEPNHVQAGLIDNTATVDSDQSNPLKDSEQVPIVLTPVLIFDKVVTGVDNAGNGILDNAGEIINYNLVVTNTGNQTLTNVIITDPLTETEQNIGSLAPGASATLPTIYTITQEDIDSNATLEPNNVIGGNIDNTATADSDQTGPVSDSEQVPIVLTPGIDIEKSVNGEDADSPTGPFLNSDTDTANFTYVVKNTGNVALSNVTVTDNRIASANIIFIGGDADNDQKLDIDETWTYEANNQDVLSGQYTNIGTAIGTAANGTQVNDTDNANYFGFSGSLPALEIKKYTNAPTAVGNSGDLVDPYGYDADLQTGPYIKVGDTVTWTYVVSNNGTVSLNNLQVTDNILGVNPVKISESINTNGILEANEIWVYTATGTAIAGQYANTGTANAVGPTGIQYTDTDPSHYFGATSGINLEKFVNNADADTAPGISVTLPTNVVFTFLVTNTGNTPISNVTVTDDKLGAITNLTGGDDGDEVLEVGEVWTYTTAPVAAQVGLQTNIGTVNGTDVFGDNVTDNDPANYTGINNPLPAAPGVRTPGFWQNTNWQKFWDGIQGNEPSQAGTTNFPTGDLLHSPYTNSAVAGQVLDPVSGTYQIGLLIGDYNRNGMTDAGEDTLFYNLAQARQLVDSSQHPKGGNQDKRYDLGRSLVATWLNYLAGNPIDTAAVGDKDVRYQINEGIDWLQALTPDENGDQSGDGALHQMVGSSVTSARVNDFWNTSFGSASALPNPYKVNTAAGFPLDSGSAINTALDNYNNTGAGATGAFYGG
jgi:uncharacterized repeat protein (TIGR01451 family)